MLILKRLSYTTLILFLIVIISSYIGIKLGNEGLLIVGNIDMPSWLEFCIGYLLFNVNTFLIMGFVLNEYSRKIIKFVLPCFLIDLILRIIFFFVISSDIVLIIEGMTPIIFTISYIIIFARKKKNFIRLLMIFGAYLIHQFLNVLPQVGGVLQNKVTNYQALVSSIDIILLLSVFYFTGGVIYVRSLEVVFPENIGTHETDLADEEAMRVFASFKGFRRLKAMSLLLGFNIFQYAIINFTNYLGNRLIESLIITASFVAYGFTVKRRWHSNTLTGCTLSSMLLFYIASRSIPTFGYSQLMPVLTALFLMYGLYLVTCRKVKSDAQ